MRGLKILLLVLLTAAACRVVTARVFQVRATAPGRLNTAGLGWERAYSTAMNINGVPNDLVVYAASRYMPVLDQIKLQFEAQGAEVELTETPFGAQGLAKADGQETRILAMAAPDGKNMLVFLFYPDPQGAAAEPAFPLPVCPGAAAEQVVSNQGSGSSCLMVRTEIDPAQVQAFYAGILSASGWQAVLPPGNGASRFALYSKNGQACAVSASPLPDGRSRVTVLVKGSTL